ncbi:MAG: hypothetical protein LUE93_12675 [Bacteroides sp.]|nr:hypothetical protein [Bacteroides sp.]
MANDKLTTEERNNLKDSDFGIPGTREFPMPDAAHVRAAESYFHYADDSKKPELAHRIMAKAKKFDVEVTSENVRKWAEKYDNK